MKVTLDEAERLLEAVKEATERTEDALDEIEAEAAKRRADARRPRQEAVRLAMDAGIPRALIADAAGVSTARLYQIVEGRR